MPHRKKKSFIEKKNAVTFHLVHRSQRDPLAADESAPQRVLLPKLDVEERREQQRKFGVFFDDDYDYLQHLKEASGPAELLPVDGEPSVPEAVTSILLPSSVFSSGFEEEVGLLNKAAPVSGPRLDMDPDIVAALDEDFDFNDPSNMLEDDFIVKANCANAESEEDEDASTDGFSGDEDAQSQDSLFMEEETKSRFTEYSLTSSVMRRNEQLSLLDDRFEKFYEQFDQDEVGALDNAELEGFIQSDSSRLQDIITDYFTEKTFRRVQEPPGLPDVTEREEEEQIEKLVTEAPREKWDCESIISTYSNLFNRPKVIEEPSKGQIRLSSKEVLRGGAPSTERRAKGRSHTRNKEETKEERKSRKQNIKLERKERRAEKKSNKMAFKMEKERQEKQMINLRTNVCALKL